ncbi:MAG TPA: Arc family DNA-binding protein [Mesorhizobium sp.]|jgi:plasmid stability protein|nr:Arc family DNA-binding protein [Mesorhizobium sp.]
MASLTIRNLNEDTKQKLRIRAAAHGRSMEEEARQIIGEAVSRPAERRKATVEEILAFRCQPKESFDQKAETDALWSYIDDL